LQQKPTHLNFVSAGIVKCLDHCEMCEFTRLYVQFHSLRQLSKNHYIWDLVLWVRDVRVQSDLYRKRVLVQSWVSTVHSESIAVQAFVTIHLDATQFMRHTT